MTVIKERPLTHRSPFYGELPIVKPRSFVRRARADLKHVDFDTIVATGMSGVPAATLLASSMGKYLFLVRKPDDKGNHHGGAAVGTLGERWLFVDDFVSGGGTYRRVAEVVEEASKGQALLVGRYCYGGEYASAEFVDPEAEWRTYYNPESATYRPLLEGIRTV